MQNNRYISWVTDLVFNENFLDTLRITASIITPIWIFFYLGKPEIGIPLGVGALLIALTDAPGTIRDKINSFGLSTLIFLLVAWCTTLTMHNPFLTALNILLTTFLLSQLSLFGHRFVLAGTSGIILMVFILGLKPVNFMSFNLYLLIGGIWYYGLALIQTIIWRYKSLRQAICECLNATSRILSAKAEFYHLDKSVEVSYDKVIKLHAKVSQTHEHLRNMLLRDPHFLKPDNKKGRSFLIATIHTIDIYEQIIAVQYDYGTLRNTFKDSGALEVIGRMIALAAEDLRYISSCIGRNSVPEKSALQSWKDTLLEKRLQLIINKETPEQAGVLRKINQNLDDISKHVHAIIIALSSDELLPGVDGELEYEKFISNTVSHKGILKTAFSYRSSLLRFSIRLSLSCLAAYLVRYFIPLGEYAYWIMLTVVVVMKPAYSLTKKRNYQRLRGTIFGVLGGFAILNITASTTLQLYLCILFLGIFFFFVKTKYTYSVIAITAMVILCLHYHLGLSHSFIWERLYDTMIGGVIAFSASYLFPVWERHKVIFYVQDVIKANIGYLEKLCAGITSPNSDLTVYKLSRKTIYTSLADMTTAFQRMLLEPGKTTSMDKAGMHRLQMLNHMLCSVVGSFFKFEKPQRPFNPEPNSCEGIERVIAELYECLFCLEKIENREQYIDGQQVFARAVEESPIKEKNISLMMEISRDIRHALTAIPLTGSRR